MQNDAEKASRSLQNKCFKTVLLEPKMDKMKRRRIYYEISLTDRENKHKLYRWKEEAERGS